MNSRNSKKFDPCRLLLNLTDKINLKRSDKYDAFYQILTCNIHGKIYKCHTRTIKQNEEW